MNRIALVGLGNMGAAVAERLASSFDVTAYDISAERRREVANGLGVRVVDSVRELAQFDTVVMCLPNPHASEAVATELAPHLSAGALVVETSTVNPHNMATLAGILEPRGVRVVDAAILSGVAGMRNGQSSILVGGSEEDVARARPVLEALGSGYTVFGGLGTGMAAKVVNNGVAHAVMVVLLEAVTVGVKAGVQMAPLVDLLADPEAGLMRPLTHRVRERVMTANYESGMPLDAARKDSTLILELAQSLGVPLFATQAAHTPYELGVSAGFGRDDYSALARLWEQWASTSLVAES